MYRNDSGTTIKGYEWKFPFLDIWMFKNSPGQIWNVIYPINVLNTNYVFPLLKRQFFDLMINAPFDTGKVLEKHKYSVDRCTSSYWSHKLEKKKKINF